MIAGRKILVRTVPVDVIPYAVSIDLRTKKGRILSSSHHFKPNVPWKRQNHNKNILQ